MGAISTLAAEYSAQNIVPALAFSLGGGLSLAITLNQFVRSQRLHNAEEDLQLESLRDTLQTALDAADERYFDQSTRVGRSPLAELQARASMNYSVLTEHYANALSQSRVYAYLSYFVGILGFLVMLLGVALTYEGSLGSGILTTVVGAIVDCGAGLVFHQSGKANSNSQSNLKQLSDAVREDNNREIAVHLVGLISDPAVRDQALSDLARQAMSHPDSAQSKPSPEIANTSEKPARADREKPEN
ncbi:hypothetical protein BST43_10640 [Mycobacteroides saopaulense]|uniref:Cyanobacterial TRADD-N associated 2 transmembrane domain-containing protein n=1 Tax=Mycobacteroides saopaulense TaxID=1578165 RepID=A0A1X0J834_9MYCO|nr:hypothetical protein [Mycobacteroides saopaulense]ORB58083.1 hypothetical protein BST43_10640 [Mycobacteroides saopaulense]